MSTRSAIIERRADGTYRGIYCHFDGYTEGVGATLGAFYRDAAKVSALIDLGEISSLGEQVESGSTLAYHRDRGEERTEPSIGATYEEVAKQIGHNGYVYVFDGERWLVNGSDLDATLARLREEVAS